MPSIRNCTSVLVCNIFLLSTQHVFAFHVIPPRSPHQPHDIQPQSFDAASAATGSSNNRSISSTPNTHSPPNRWLVVYGVTTATAEKPPKDDDDDDENDEIINTPPSSRRSFLNAALLLSTTTTGANLLGALEEAEEAEEELTTEFIELKTGIESSTSIGNVDGGGGIAPSDIDESTGTLFRRNFFDNIRNHMTEKKK